MRKARKRPTKKGRKKHKMTCSECEVVKHRSYFPGTPSGPFLSANDLERLHSRIDGGLTDERRGDATEPQRKVPYVAGG